MPIRPKAMAIRTIPRQLKFGSLLRLLSRWELRSGCAISFGARTLAALEKLHQQVGNAMSRSHAFGIRHQIGGGVRWAWGVHAPSPSRTFCLRASRRDRKEQARRVRSQTPGRAAHFIRHRARDSSMILAGKPHSTGIARGAADPRSAAE